MRSLPANLFRLLEPRWRAVCRSEPEACSDFRTSARVIEFGPVYATVFRTRGERRNPLFERRWSRSRTANATFSPSIATTVLDSPHKSYRGSSARERWCFRGLLLRQTFWATNVRNKECRSRKSSNHDRWTRRGTDGSEWEARRGNPSSENGANEGQREPQSDANESAFDFGRPRKTRIGPRCTPGAVANRSGPTRAVTNAACECAAGRSQTRRTCERPASQPRREQRKDQQFD